MEEGWYGRPARPIGCSRGLGRIECRVAQAHADFDTDFGYDSGGRLNRVTGPGLPAEGAVYSFAADSDIVSQIAWKSDSSTTVAITIRSFECTSGLGGGVKSPRFFQVFYFNRTLCCILTYAHLTTPEPLNPGKSACQTRKAVVCFILVGLLSRSGSVARLRAFGPEQSSIHARFRSAIRFPCLYVEPQRAASSALRSRAVRPFVASRQPG